jgi:tetratricopeptide (TPR) repeat protein
LIARLALALTAVLVLMTHAQADSSSVASARAHFERGKALYAAERYQDAIVEFQRGFELVPRPLFLLNMGHAHRKLGELRAARAMYQKYVDAVAPDDPDRAPVSELIGKLDEQIARQPLPPSRPRPEEVEPAPRVAAAPPPPPRRPFIRRHWWIIPVSVVALGGLGLGLYFGLRGRDDGCSGYSYGCVTVGD